jgi:hypothetical protein
MRKPTIRRFLRLTQKRTRVRNWTVYRGGASANSALDRPLTAPVYLSAERALQRRRSGILALLVASMSASNPPRRRGPAMASRGRTGSRKVGGRRGSMLPGARRAIHQPILKLVQESKQGSNASGSWFLCPRSEAPPHLAFPSCGATTSAALLHGGSRLPIRKPPWHID